MKTEKESTMQFHSTVSFLKTLHCNSTRQIVISKGLANFVTIFSDLAFIVTFGNFDKELVNFGWNALVTMMFKINIRQSTADF